MASGNFKDDAEGSQPPETKLGICSERSRAHGLGPPGGLPASEWRAACVSAGHRGVEHVPRRPRARRPPGWRDPEPGRVGPARPVVAGPARRGDRWNAAGGTRHSHRQQRGRHADGIRRVDRPDDLVQTRPRRNLELAGGGWKPKPRFRGYAHWPTLCIWPVARRTNLAVDRSARFRAMGVTRRLPGRGDHRHRVTLWRCPAGRGSPCWTRCLHRTGALDEVRARRMRARRWFVVDACD